MEAEPTATDGATGGTADDATDPAATQCARSGVVAPGATRGDASGGDPAATQCIRSGADAGGAGGGNGAGSDNGGDPAATQCTRSGDGVGGAVAADAAGGEHADSGGYAPPGHGHQQGSPPSASGQAIVPLPHAGEDVTTADPGAPTTALTDPIANEVYPMKVQQGHTRLAPAMASADAPDPARNIDFPIDFWISEDWQQRIVQKQQPRASPTLRTLDAAQLDAFQDMLKADPPLVKPVGRFTCCDSSEGTRDETVERSYWFEMPGSTWGQPLFTIVHVHFSGLWCDYEKNPSDDATGRITQVNVQHSCDGPGLIYEDERFYGILAERGVGHHCVFDDKRNGKPWDWRRDQVLLTPDPDGFAAPGRPSKPAWVLRLLRLFDKHPFYRGHRSDDGSTPHAAKRRRIEPGINSSCATTSTSIAPVDEPGAGHCYSVPGASQVSQGSDRPALSASDAYKASATHPAERATQCSTSANAAGETSQTLQKDNQIDDDKCKICGTDENPAALLLCDSCDGGYHIYCLQPHLCSVPDGNWYCSACLESAASSNTLAALLAGAPQDTSGPASVSTETKPRDEVAEDLGASEHFEDSGKVEVHLDDVPGLASWYPAIVLQTCAGWAQVQLYTSGATTAQRWVPCVAVRTPPATPSHWNPVGDAYVELWYENSGLGGWWKCAMLSTVAGAFYEVIYEPASVKHRATIDRLRPISLRCDGDKLLLEEHRSLLSMQSLTRKKYCLDSSVMGRFDPVRGDPAASWQEKYEPLVMGDDGLTPKEQLLVFVCSPRVSPIKDAENEAVRIAAATWGAYVSILNGGTPTELADRLKQNHSRRFLFIGHADAILNDGQPTLGFTNPRNDALELATPSVLAEIFADSKLQLIFLNGCCSEALGRAIMAKTNRGCWDQYDWRAVVCWRSRCESSAASVFSIAFFRHIICTRENNKCANVGSMGIEKIRSAFRAAKQAVLLVTRPGQLGNGIPANVPKYQFFDPDEQRPTSKNIVFTPEPWSVGLPVLLVLGAVAPMGDFQVDTFT